MEEIQAVCLAKVYSTLEELDASYCELIQAAKLTLQNAYAPYSNFRVGAALLLSNGQIVCGSNQENAAYPSGLCAERVALYSAFSQYPEAHLCTIAVAAATLAPDGISYQSTAKPVTPCGACRQAIAEYLVRSPEPVPVLLTSAKEVWLLNDARSLLPFAFEL